MINETDDQDDAPDEREDWATDFIHDANSVADALDDRVGEVDGLKAEVVARMLRGIEAFHDAAILALGVEQDRVSIAVLRALQDLFMRLEGRRLPTNLPDWDSTTPASSVAAGRDVAPDPQQ